MVAFIDFSLICNDHLLICSDDSKYLSQIEDSGWLENIRRLLEISSSVAWEIENEKSTVLVAYDDGVDRTSQVRIPSDYTRSVPNMYPRLFSHCKMSQ